VEKITAHELALNPDVFTGRSDELILSTLVHEMVHVWQETHGTDRSYDSAKENVDFLLGTPDAPGA
jgi:hypothetical protein